MRPIRLGCGIITEQVSECKEFYCHLFGYRVASESQWHVRLRSEDGSQEIEFLSPAQISQPSILQHEYQGRGCWINVEVESVDEAFDHLLGYSVSVLLEPRNEPWGERHFIIRDPARMAVNVVQRIDARGQSELP